MIFCKKSESKEKILKRVESLHEYNPMLGMRGVRLGIHIPGTNHDAGSGGF